MRGGVFQMADRQNHVYSCLVVTVAEKAYILCQKDYKQGNARQFAE
jgi:hypothetical protein